LELKALVQSVDILYIKEHVMGKQTKVLMKNTNGNAIVLRLVKSAAVTTAVAKYLAETSNTTFVASNGTTTTSTTSTTTSLPSSISMISTCTTCSSVSF
jgi:hypothetical protein